MTLLDDFFIRALLAGIGVALAAGPLGCLVVWRRMSYFGDTIAHGGLAGVALGVALGVDPVFGVIAAAVVVSLMLLAIRRSGRLPNDAILGMLSHSALSFGLIAIALMRVRIDLQSFLFGDVLAVARADLTLIYLGGAGVLACLALAWRPLVAASVDRDIASAEGVNADRIGLLFMLLVAVTVALAIKVVGVLLVTALLVIPAVAARRFSRTPERMAMLAPLIGCAAVVAGLYLSLALDTPSGPSIVASAFGLFLLSAVLGGLAERIQARSR